MIEEVKILLGSAADNFTESQIGLAIKHALAEIEAYCNREVDYELKICAVRIAVLKLLRTNTEGLASQSLSGVSESYIDGYPADIQAVLDRKRKIKVLG